jgi:DNA-binding NtrC family response regulator
MEGTGPVPKVLIVEDRKNDRHLLQETVRSMGEDFVSVAARSALEAIEAMRNGAPVDVILLDVNLAGYISGESLLQRKELAGIPVIVVSGIEEIDLKMLKIRFPNVKRYVRKPVGSESLRDAIAACLK